MGPGDLIRPADHRDLGELQRLLIDCVAAMQRDGIDQWDAVYPDTATVVADVTSGTLYLASGAARQLLGCVVLNSKQDPEYADVPWQETSPPIGVVHRLMVSPTARRRGVATTLMRFAEQRARELGYRALRLDTFLGNPAALHLYQSLGYRAAGTVRFRKGEFRCFERSLALR